MKTKVCSLCCMQKPEDQFFKKWEAKDGLQSQCKDCSIEKDTSFLSSKKFQIPQYTIRKDYGTVGYHYANV